MDSPPYLGDHRHPFSTEHWGNGYQIHKAHSIKKGVLALYNIEQIFLLTTIFQAQTKQVLGNRASITPHLNKQTYNSSELYTLRLLITYHWSIIQIHTNHALHTLVNTLLHTFLGSLL